MVRSWRNYLIAGGDEDEDFVTFRFIHEVINKIKERDEVQS